MKVLITGGLGHIGSKLIREYAKREDIELIRILDDISTERYCSLFDLPEVTKFEFIDGSINDDLKKAVDGVELVIHLAAVTDAPATLDKPDETFKVNLEAVEKILNYSSKAGVKKFLFPSTTSVYGEAEGLIDENWPRENYKPSSPYAQAKFKAEEKVIEANEKLGLNTNVLRFGTIFGTSVGMRFHTAVNKFCFLAALGKPLTVWDSAINNKRPYLGLDDAIRSLEFIEKHGNPGELYNVLTENYTVQEMVDAIRKWEPTLQTIITKSPILNQKSYFVSDKKVRDLGFVPRDSLSEEVRKTLELFKAIKNE
jgi:UDP-glucose 4-epimerase